jgi:2-dehydropantoate 2-reductase
MICGACVMAMARVPAGLVVACAETRVFLRDVVTEVVAVGRAAGVRLSEDLPEQALAITAAYSPWAKPSILVDLEAGRRLELDALTGLVVRLGRELGAATPANTAIYAALMPYRDGAPTMPAPPT